MYSGVLDLVFFVVCLAAVVIAVCMTLLVYASCLDDSIKFIRICNVSSLF